MSFLQLHRWTQAGAAALSRVAAPLNLPPAIRPGGLRMAGASGHAKACVRQLLAGAALLLAGAQAATPPGTLITNAATASFSVSGVAITANGAASVTTSG